MAACSARQFLLIKANARPEKKKKRGIHHHQRCTAARACGLFTSAASREPDSPGGAHESRIQVGRNLDDQAAGAKTGSGMRLPGVASGSH